RVGRSPQKIVQLLKLPPLALPPHPLTFALAPDAPAMQQEKPLGGTVTSVEARDPLDRSREEPVIVRHRLRGRIGPVGQEGEVDRTVRIGEIMDLQAVD